MSSERKDMDVKPVISLSESVASRDATLEAEIHKELGDLVAPSVELLRLRKGDRIVIRLDRSLDNEARNRLRDLLAIRFKGYDVFVLDPGVSISVIRGAKN